LAKWTDEQEKNADNATSSTSSVRKQYEKIKKDIRDPDPCKYGADCKYQFKGCRYSHPKDEKRHVELVKEFARPDSSSSSYLSIRPLLLI
jgi:hypothetical protein